MPGPALRFESLALFLTAALLAGCAGFSGTNVGEPTTQNRIGFEHKLDALYVGMPADSLEAIFATADEPGDTGILLKSKIVTEDFERITYTLGWKSDPRHQIGVKDMHEINVERASVLVEDSRVVSIELRD